IDGQAVGMVADENLADQLRRRGLYIDDLQEEIEQLLLRGVVVARWCTDDRELAVGRHGDGLRRSLDRVLDPLEGAPDDRRRLRSVDHYQAVRRCRLRKRRAAFDANKLAVLRRDDDVRGEGGSAGKRGAQRSRDNDGDAERRSLELHGLLRAFIAHALAASIDCHVAWLCHLEASYQLANDAVTGCRRAGPPVR